MKAPTEMQLRTMTPEQRMTVRTHAVRLGGEIGSATVALIDSLNLPLSSGGMSQDHPLYREMQEIVWSAEGKSAAVQVVEEGLPAMAGIDPLLQKVMGDRYGLEYQGTSNAAYIVGELMRVLEGEAELPSGCAAKTAATWRPTRPFPKW
jgi:hypothetical protein